MINEKFSKDPKIKLVSIDEFYESSNYLSNVKKNLWKENEKPSYGTYYKITSKYLIKIKYTFTLSNFGTTLTEKLDSIQVAYRDGENEYQLLDEKLKNLTQEYTNQLDNKILERNIKNIKLVKKILKNSPFSNSSIIENRDFEEYISNTGYKTNIDDYFGKYVVFDVETNGTRRSNDDLLSISIYDPTNGKCYNRFLPLELQPLVLTGWINGIRDETLENIPHLTQKELNQIIEYFDLNNKILLSFSGGQGTFDSSCIINYCKRHNLYGFENLQYENIKSLIPNPGFGYEGQMSKDNLCKLLKIEGVQEVHSGLNDCVLEWKLFEKLKNEPLFFINQQLFKYHKDYVVPVTYLNKHKELISYADISLPSIMGKAECIFEFNFPKEIQKEIKKFSTNITGIALENGIYNYLNVEDQNNYNFLAKNKSHLEYIGSIESNITEIPIEIQKDGSIKSLNRQFDDDVDEVNKVTKKVMDSLTPVFDFIKKEIFKNDKILNQELTISNDGKILALCDLSDSNNILEIKTYNISQENNYINDDLTRQLYYESKGRNIYILSIEIANYIDEKNKYTTNSNARIYHVSLEQTESKDYDYIHTLSLNEKAILNIIKENPLIKNIEIANKLGLSKNYICDSLRFLKLLKYIVKEDESKKYSKWIMLRQPDDDMTKI